MQYRRLRGTDLDVSVICVGPMRAAAREPGDDPRSQAGERALRQAIDGGVNFIHSSYEYGTRWMLSRVLKDHPKRSELHHVIKVPVPDAEDEGRFKPEKFRMRVEEALRDLHTERIDVLQWMVRSKPNDDEHRLPILPEVIDDAVATFAKMRDEGKVGHLFTFPYTVPFARAAIATGKVEGLIDYHSVIETQMSELFDELEQRDMGFLAIRPLYQGILTDERADPASLPEGDRFRHPDHAEDFAKRRKVVEAFEAEIGTSMTRFAIRFALASPVVASVVVGMNTPEQVRGMLEAAEGPVPEPGIVQRAHALWQ